MKPDPPQGGAADLRKTIVEPAEAESGPTPLSQVAGTNIRQTIVEPFDEADDEVEDVSPLAHVAGTNIRQTILEPVEAETPHPPLPAESPASRGRQTISEPLEQPVGGSTIQQQPAASLPAKSTGETVRFRPSLRPKLARLFVLDDCGTDAEMIRIRAETFRIGRTKGDLTIAHDAQMSAEHVEISREVKNNKWKWKLRDLDSTNGTFVSVQQSPLEDGQELFLGGNLYRFVEEVGDSASPPPVPDKNQTRLPGQAAIPTGSPSARLIKGDGTGRVVARFNSSQWIGRDANHCTIVVDDPMLGEQDSRIFLEGGRWFIKKGKSRNGLWVRVPAVTMGRGMKFQCGEQRFELRLE